MWKKILSVAGALIVLGGFVTTGWLLDDRYAKADDAKQNKTNIMINQHKNDIRWYQDQMSYIMTRCGVRDPNVLPTHAHKNYMDYKIKKEALDSELKILMQRRNRF
jgi:hypothetical protein